MSTCDQFYDCSQVVVVDAADGDGLAFEVDVAVAVAGVGAGSDDYGVVVSAGVDGGLDGREIGRAIAIDGDSPGVRERCKGQN